MTQTADTSPDLLAALARLGDEYGPLGVALAAAEHTDKAAIVRQWRANGEDLPRVVESPVAMQTREPSPPRPARPLLDGGGIQQPEEYAPAPFQCMDEVENEVKRLDDWVGNFIGRMQPYMKNVDLPEPDVLARAMCRTEDRSPLENRILLQRDLISEIIDRLDDMNVKLAL